MNYLNRDVISYICQYLDNKSLSRLSRASTILSKLCNNIISSRLEIRKTQHVVALSGVRSYSRYWGNDNRREDTHCIVFNYDKFIYVFYSANHMSIAFSEFNEAKIMEDKVIEDISNIQLLVTFLESLLVGNFECLMFNSIRFILTKPDTICISKDRYIIFNYPKFCLAIEQVLKFITNVRNDRMFNIVSNMRLNV